MVPAEWNERGGEGNIALKDKKESVDSVHSKRTQTALTDNELTSSSSYLQGKCRRKPN